MTSDASGPAVQSKPVSFRDPEPLAKFIRVLLYLQIALAATNIASSLLQYNLLSDFQNGVYQGDPAGKDAAAQSNDLRESIVGITTFILFLFTAFFILKWIYRSAQNAKILGFNPMKTSPGWAIGWYFVPFANLYMPYKAMKEIWLASHSPVASNERENTALIGWWWALFIISGVLGRIELQTALHSNTIDELLAATKVEIVSAAFDIPLNLVFLSLMARIVKAQKQDLSLVFAG